MAPPQKRRAERSAADRADGKLVVARRAPREQVLERDQPEVHGHRAGQRHRQQAARDPPPTERRGEDQRRRALGDGLRDEIEGRLRPLPQVAGEALREQEPGVAGRRAARRRPPARRAQ